MVDRDLTRFSGEHKESNRRLGTESLVTVDLFKRPNETFFMRVSLRSNVRPIIISRHEVDLDRYTGEREFLKMVLLDGGALAEHQDQTLGDSHDPAECAKAAVRAATEILHSQDIQVGG